MASSLVVIEGKVDPLIVLESNLTATLEHTTGEQNPLGKKLESVMNTIVSPVVCRITRSKGIKDSRGSTVGIHVTIINLIVTIRSNVLEAIDEEKDLLLDLVVVLHQTFQFGRKTIAESLVDVVIECVLLVVVNRAGHAAIVEQHPAFVKLGVELFLKRVEILLDHR